MPTSSTFNSPQKCKKCLKDFTQIWIPNKECCMIERLNAHVDDEFFRRQEMRKLRNSSTVRDLHSFVTHNTGTPFCTLQPTCGSNFSPDTNHKKYKHGVLPADLSKWQNKNHGLQQPIVRPLATQTPKKS
ncbi:hypothetical protein ACHWQZ_G010269 [Mnemiopsis leidyi]